MKRKISRRKFLADSSAAAITFSIMTSCMHSCTTVDKANGNGTSGGKTVMLNVNDASYAVLAQSGGTAKVTIDGQTQPAIVVRISESEVAAFSSECTHQQCQVNLPDSNGVVRCPCHGSTYDNRGKLLGGLASRDLPSFSASIEGAIITITT